MRVPETDQRLSFYLETLDIFFGKRDVQDFESGVALEIAMFAQVDRCKTSLSSQLDKTVIAKLLAKMIGHSKDPLQRKCIITL